jgi:2-polyprenyl-3-methyl-5-hydroxy-6-metoxy-1,4-benzoquinol methylase
MVKTVHKNKWGFYEISTKPDTQELKHYYADKYYQNDCGNYEKTYSGEEIAFFKNKLAQKYAVIEELLLKGLPYRTFLDIGAGEGWALSFFREQGWIVTGLDFSKLGCAHHNPDCLEKLIVGDIYNNIENLASKKSKFQVVLLDNVLEHVDSPLSLLKKIQLLIHEEGILIIEVPNDFSVIQNYALTKKYISRPFWVVYPDHLSYFNKEGLIALCQDAGFSCEKIMGDYPIDFNILNKNTNYIENKQVGKSCHQSRVEIENLIHEISVEKANQFFTALGAMGLGRSIIGFFRPIH